MIRNLPVNIGHHHDRSVFPFNVGAVGMEAMEVRALELGRVRGWSGMYGLYFDADM